MYSSRDNVLIISCASLCRVENFPWQQFGIIVEYQPLTIDLGSILRSLKQRFILIQLISVEHSLTFLNRNTYDSVEETEEWILRVRYSQYFDNND
jgi:hypothetical protein